MNPGKRPFLPLVDWLAFVGYWPRALTGDDVLVLSDRLWRGALGQPGSLL